MKREDFSKEDIIKSVDMARGGYETCIRSKNSHPLLALLKQAAEQSGNPDTIAAVKQKIGEVNEQASHPVAIIVVATEEYALAHGVTQAELDAIVQDEEPIQRTLKKAERRAHVHNS